jgi:hypothetical protein
VPFTVPTSLQPIGSFGFTRTSGLLPTFGGLSLAKAFAEKQIATRMARALIVISPSPSWRGSDAIRVLLFSLTLRSGRAILRYYPRLLSSWPISSTDAPRLRSIAEAVASSLPLHLEPELDQAADGFGAAGLIVLLVGPLEVGEGVRPTLDALMNLGARKV